MLNLYLTIFFLSCLSRSFRLSSGSSGISWFRRSRPSETHERRLSAELRALTRRTVAGLVINLTGTAINLVSMIVLNGEAMWFCWITCKADIMVNVIVLFWMTSPRGERGSETATTKTTTMSRRNGSHDSSADNGTTITMVELTDMLAGPAEGKPSPIHTTRERRADDSP
ncbi:uncharacterized protein B0I36DRAFT_164443 [Microdochium trichocladiopsis]|uniref:Uncharacterized protein n=1 Tax=Microdochium trichocladiopsis TaxID=1682393 RepID=A0A9P8XZ92_9PEZI|nr:uncharacterized protein B0I36DRAFT_164443 [Microdochium trichocladiopsis]KAH7024795.1 hypothetical protein B0I36DRAFT_164443 [Microdochium trichocladiopsis]